MYAEEHALPSLKREELLALSRLNNCFARKRRCFRIAMNVAVIAGVCGVILFVLLIPLFSHGGKEVATKAVGTDLLRQAIQTAFVSIATLLAWFGVPALFAWFVASVLLSTRRSAIQKEINACALDPATRTGLLSIRVLLNTHDAIHRRIKPYDQLVIDGPDGIYLHAEVYALFPTIVDQP